MARRRVAVPCALCGQSVPTATQWLKAQPDLRRMCSSCRLRQKRLRLALHRAAPRIEALLGIAREALRQAEAALDAIPDLREIERAGYQARVPASLWISIEEMLPEWLRRLGAVDDK